MDCNKCVHPNNICGEKGVMGVFTIDKRRIYEYPLDCSMWFQYAYISLGEER